MKYILHNQTRHRVFIRVRRDSEQVFAGKLGPFRFRRLPHEFRKPPTVAADRDGVEVVTKENWDRKPCNTF